MQAAIPRHWWQRRIPLNYRTIIFILLEGLSLGVPAFLVRPEALCEKIRAACKAPEWFGAGVALMCVLCGLILLPIWSIAALKEHRWMRLFGLWTFAVVFILMLLPK